VDSNQIQIFDDALNQQVFDDISSLIMSRDFAWYYKPESTQKYAAMADVAESHYSYQFSHMFYFNQVPLSEHFMPTMIPVLEKLNCFSLVRMSANFMPPMQGNYIQGIHTDSPTQCRSAILYLNTNNGKTVFQTGEEIESIANRLVVFDSNLEHSGVTATDLGGRYVLNILFFPNQNGYA